MSYVKPLLEEQEIKIAVSIISYGKTAREVAKPFDISGNRARLIAIKKFKQLIPETYKELNDNYRWKGLFLYRRYRRVFSKAVSIRFIERAESTVLFDVFSDNQVKNAFENLKKLVRERGLNKGKDPEYYI